MFNKEIVRYFLLQFFYLSNKKERKWRKFDKCVFQKLKEKVEAFFFQNAQLIIPSSKVALKATS